MLWNRSLVMIDKETGSLWSHILGRAMRGPLKGESLELLPGVMTDWKTWKTEHPHTTVANLSRTAKRFVREMYKDPTKYLIGITQGADTKAWSFDQLLKQPVVNDTFQNDPILVAFDKTSSSALLYERTLNDKELEFLSQDGQLHDTATHSTWNPATGKATAGKLKGKQLKPIPGVISFTKAWKTFHPKTVFWKAK